MSFALVLGGGGAKGGALAGFQHKYVQQLQALASGCVMADRDLVLPGRIDDDGTGVVLILASTDADGARALADHGYAVIAHDQRGHGHTARTESDLGYLADEQGWDRAKIGRREHVAEDYRVIMLFGDDLGDFTPCVRKKLYGPCTEPATRESRAKLIEDHRELWGHGWYILPGPMHGSWTSFQ